MADKLIVGTAAGEHVKVLLGDETLSTAFWSGPTKSKAGGTRLGDARVQAKCNPQHFVFHYTDIPFEEAAYRDNSVGATNDDVVHAIPACILILEGRAAEQTLFTNVPPRVALRLLVHYLEDLHQPLHVGSGYLNGTNFVDPNGYGKPYHSDQGGNLLVFDATNKLHFYWDVTVVQADMTNAHVENSDGICRLLVGQTRPGLPGFRAVDELGPEDWANESLALSAKVHDVVVKDRGRHSRGFSHGRAASAVGHHGLVAG